MTLQDELLTDPLGRGYSGMTDLEVAASLNTVDRKITATFLTGSQIFNATDDVEYAALNAAKKTSWDALCAIDMINTGSGVAKAREKELFGPGTQTRTNLINIRKSTVSRAQELGLSRVREGTVARAR